MLALARAGRVGLPLRTPHQLMCLYTLTAHLAAPPAGDPADPTELFDPRCATEAYERLRELIGHVDPEHAALDPIAVFERMAAADSTIDCVPLIYGYVNYAWPGFRATRLAFADMPTIGGRAPKGSALGGTGIAVSARSTQRGEAVAFALWLASAEVQRGPYAEAGGQPGHAAAWQDDAVNRAAGDFYRATRATLQGAWVRPRHDGYMAFQHAASERLGEGLRHGEAATTVIADLNRLHRGSLRGD
jgi:multiple sugar transport system substrate-binding protein